jgi:voltage-gated potassium channel Kch
MRAHQVVYRLQRWWWAALLVAGLVALALGVWGYQRVSTTKGLGWSRWDVFYFSLQLFTLGFATSDGPVPLPLQVARFLAAFVAFSTVIATVMRIFYDRLQLLGLQFVRNHVVLCGLGQRGDRLVEALRNRGDRVVVIEADPRHEGLAHCRALGAVVLVGAVTDPWILRQARVQRARLLMALFGGDGDNVETAVAAHALNGARLRGKLRCVLQVSDPRLRHLVLTREAFTRTDDAFELEVFNLFEVVARVMLRESLPAAGGTTRVAAAADADAPEPPCLLVVGLGRLGETLVLRAARDWWLDRRVSEEKLAVTAVARDASSWARRLCAEYPFLADVCRLECHDMDVRGPEFQRGEFLPDPSGTRVTAAYVCIGDDTLALLAALRLHELLQEQERRVPIQVRMTESTGLARLFERTADGRAGGPFPSTVGLQDIACTLALVADPLRESLAQTIHQEYLRHQRSLGKTAAADRALVPWRELPEGLKESNRQQAEHVPVKLRAIGRRALPQAGHGHGDVPRPFSEAEVETLARLEHERWVAERTSAGWRHGPEKDIDRKISPHLVPWDQLSDEVKEYDRNAVRKLPLILAKADYTIVPLASNAPLAQP